MAIPSPTGSLKCETDCCLDQSHADPNGHNRRSTWLGKASLLEVARLFAETGAAIAVVASRDIAKAQGVAATLEGTMHRGFACRIEDSTEFAALGRAVEAEMDGTHILVNCAGFTRAIPHGDLEALDDETLDRILSVNTRAGFSAVRACAPQLRAGGDGLVVQISSIAATTAVV